MPNNRKKGNNKAETTPAAMIVDKDMLDTLSKSLNNLLKSDKQVEVDPNDLSSIVNMVVQAVKVITEHVETGCSQAKEVTEGAKDSIEREYVDELDECRQRSFKGNLIITSHALNGKVSLIKSDQQLDEEKKDITDHVVDLVKEKFNVTLDPKDIQACHRLPKNAIILKIWNRKAGSAWSQIIEGIKTGKNIGVNVFFNFQLTKRRSKLLYKIRQLKKSGKISKFYSDENGMLTVKMEEGGEKVKVTYFNK